MNLYFTCPKKKTTFSSADYSLNPGYRVVGDQQGHRTLQGTVSLMSDCPCCGERHEYDAGEVICPLSEGQNGQ